MTLGPKAASAGCEAPRPGPNVTGQYRRVFICGDAAHLWMPMGGYGMSSGIADAANLSWLIAATLDGWAPPAILDACEAEHRPVTEQVSRFLGLLRHHPATPRGVIRNDFLTMLSFTLATFEGPDDQHRLMIGCFRRPSGRCVGSFTVTSAVG